MSRVRVPPEGSIEALIQCLRPEPERAPASVRLAALVAWSRCARALWTGREHRLRAWHSGRVEGAGADAEREAADWSRLALGRGARRFVRRDLARLPECAAGDWSEVLVHRAGSALLVLQFDREIGEADRALLDAVVRRFAASEADRETRRPDPEHERLLQIGRSAGALVHDLRHLLTLAELQLQRARIDADPAAAREWLESLGATIAEARVCCSAGLAGAGREPRPAQGEHSQLLQDAARAATEIGGRGAAVSVLVECPQGISLGRDPVALARLVRNLVLNAIEASADGSQVHVDAVASGDRDASLRVRDRGRGISACDLERLYTRAHSGGRGSGLGTLSVLDAVVALRGTLEVESRPGAGTSVEIRFPVRETGPRLVLVDPWAERRRIRAARLERSGTEVRAVADPAEAIGELDPGAGSIERILIARGAGGEGLALLLERATTLGIPHAWIGARDRCFAPA
jgi:signal transduction histidine kinase